MKPSAVPRTSGELLATSMYVTAPQCFPNVFSDEECAAIVALGDGGLQYRCAQLRPVEGGRSALSLWIEPDDAPAFVLERLWTFLEKVNGFYRFELSGFRDPFLLCQYRTGDGFDWHLDLADEPTSTRKLAFSVQLSHPEEYDGGRLEFMPSGEIPFSRGKGSVIVFPAYLCHRVTRVTRGVRSSIVGWAHGPSFR